VLRAKRVSLGPKPLGIEEEGVEDEGVEEEGVAREDFLDFKYDSDLHQWH